MEVRDWEMSIDEGEELKCKSCVKCYECLDYLLYYIVNDHPGLLKGKQFKVGAQFLLKHGYMYEEECEDDKDPNIYAMEVEHDDFFTCYEGLSISKYWEVIDSDDEFDYFEQKNAVEK